MYPGNFDHLILRRILGPEVIHFDTYKIIEGMDIVPNKDLEVKIKDFKCSYALLNSYVYLLNIGCLIELTKQNKKSFYFYENREHYIKNCEVLK